MSKQNELLVIGAGLAGLMTAYQAAGRGQKVRVIAKGWGATHWHSGCIDVLGYYPVDAAGPVVELSTAVSQLIAANPQHNNAHNNAHPYALVGLDGLQAALEAVQALAAEAGYPLHGSLEKNWLLPSATGTFRPTCLAPETMIAGDLSQDEPMLLVGLKQLADFYPNIVAANLNKQGKTARYVMLDLPMLAQRRFNNAVLIARMMEQVDLRSELVTALKPHLGQAGRIGFPAILGLHQSLAVKTALEQELGRAVFEIPSLPPSVPGIRLHQIFKRAIEQQGAYVYDGMEALRAESEKGRVTAVLTEAAARPRRHRFEKYVLATGGILGGGITTNIDGEAREVVFDLPVNAPDGRLNWFKQQFMDKEGHPIYRSGLTVDENFQPVNGSSPDRGPVYENVYAAGTTLAHCEVIRERSFEGVALATGYRVGRNA
jgi:glycerol-3-phosphate dehydrogenase subunit B